MLAMSSDGRQGSPPHCVSTLFRHSLRRMLPKPIARRWQGPTRWTAGAAAETPILMMTVLDRPSKVTSCARLAQLGPERAAPDLTSNSAARGSRLSEPAGALASGHCVGWRAPLENVGLAPERWNSLAGSLYSLRAKTNCLALSPLRHP